MKSITLHEFQKMALKVLPQFPEKTYFYVQFMLWHGNKYSNDNVPTFDVCYYTTEGNFSENSTNPQIAIEGALLKYKNEKLKSPTILRAEYHILSAEKKIMIKNFIDFKSFEANSELGFTENEIRNFMEHEIFGGRGFSNLKKYFVNITLSENEAKETIYHTNDVYNAIICSMEERELNQTEFD